MRGISPELSPVHVLVDPLPEPLSLDLLPPPLGQVRVYDVGVGEAAFATQVALERVKVGQLLSHQLLLDVFGVAKPI